MYTDFNTCLMVLVSVLFIMSEQQDNIRFSVVLYINGCYTIVVHKAQIIKTCRSIYIVAHRNICANLYALIAVMIVLLVITITLIPKQQCGIIVVGCMIIYICNAYATDLLSVEMVAKVYDNCVRDYGVHANICTCVCVFINGFVCDTGLMKDVMQNMSILCSLVAVGMSISSVYKVYIIIQNNYMINKECSKLLNINKVYDTNLDSCKISYDLLHDKYNHVVNKYNTLQQEFNDNLHISKYFQNKVFEMLCINALEYFENLKETTTHKCERNFYDMILYLIQCESNSRKQFAGTYWGLHIYNDGEQLIFKLSVYNGTTHLHIPEDKYTNLTYDVVMLNIHKNMTNIVSCLYKQERMWCIIYTNRFGRVNFKCDNNNNNNNKEQYDIVYEKNNMNCGDHIQ